MRVPPNRLVKSNEEINNELKGEHNSKDSSRCEFPEKQLRKSGGMYEIIWNKQNTGNHQKVTDVGLAEGITVEDSSSCEKITRQK